jgi:hypothetical protein
MCVERQDDVYNEMTRILALRGAIRVLSMAYAYKPTVDVHAIIMPAIWRLERELHEATLAP